MASNLEFVPFKDFVESLSSVDSVKNADKSVVCNPSDGPRAIPGSANGRSTTLDDFREGDLIPVDGTTLARIPKDKVLVVTARNALTFKNVVAMSGNGTVASISKDFVCRPNSIYRVKISNPGWAVTSLTSSYLKLAIRGVASDGSTTNLFQAYVPTILHEYVYLKTDGYSILSIFFRGDVGQTVDFTLEPVADATLGSAVYLPLKIYGKDNTAVIEKFGAVPGSSIAIVPKATSWNVENVSSGVAIFILRYYDGNDATHDLIKYNKGDLLPALIESTIPSDATGMDLYVRADVGETLDFSVFCGVPNSSVSKLNILGNNSTKRLSFAGKGTTPVTQAFNVESPAKIVVIPSKIDWNVSSITDFSNKFILRYYDSGDTTHNIIEYSKNKKVPAIIEAECPKDVTKMDIFFRANAGESVSFDVFWLPLSSKICDFDVREIAKDAPLLSVNHRGYNSVAPENTIPAFRLSAAKGFPAVETDVQITSDDEFVCIHDTTVDRTSNGSGNVADKTLAELKALDFGSWKSSAYTGVKIPTLEEFVACCKSLGLSMFIELKGGLGKLSSAVNIVREYGMLDRVCWESGTKACLEEISSILPSAKLTLIRFSYDSSVLDSALSLKNSTNKVALGLPKELITDAIAEELMANGLLLETWLVDSASDVVHPYVSAATSDVLVAAYSEFEKEMQKEITAF